MLTKNKILRRERLIEAKGKGTHSKKEWDEMASFFRMCVKCKGASRLINIERDHIVPIYQGGSDSIRNIQPFCARCNASKGRERKDYRKTFCEDKNIEFPNKWDHDSWGR